MHVHGGLTAFLKTWYAMGNYVNDDGETLDVTGLYNYYQVASYNQGTTITFKVKTAMQKTGTDPKVNEADLLKSIFFYNAELLDMNSASYKATYTYQDQTTQEVSGSAVYDADTDRLVLTVGDDVTQKELFNIDTIVLTVE